MSGAIDNGGPAFPEVVQRYNPDRNVDETISEGGATLRDYFAIHTSIGHGEETELTVSTAAKLMGGDPPIGAENFVWWRDAEARLRYAKADAMLKARRS